MDELIGLTVLCEIKFFHSEAAVIFAHFCQQQAETPSLDFDQLRK